LENKKIEIANEAKNLISHLKTFRSYYNDMVISKLRDDEGIKINFDHKEHNDTIPLPATALHDLSGLITKNSDIKVSFFSDYPFPNRADRILDNFQNRALKAVEKNPNDFYTEVDEIEGKKYYRIAVADSMNHTACIGCHNTRADTPKNDWNIGDVRGVLEVSKPLGDNLVIFGKQSELFLKIALGVLLYLIVHYSVLALGRQKELTDKKELLEKEKEIRDELEIILATTKDGIAILDLDTRFLYANRAYENMTGFSKDELLTKSCAQMSAKEDYERALNAVKEVMEKGYVDEFEKTCIVKNNKKIKISMTISLMPDKKRLLISTKDITEKSRLEKQIKDYLKLIDRYIISSSTDLEGNITTVSDAFCKISKYKREELIGQNHRIIRHPDMPNSLYEDLWETITANVIWEGEIKNRAKDGSTYWVWANIASIIDENGKKVGYTAIRQDITDKKRAEELSITDRLTGLYNRLKLDEVFCYELTQAKRYDRALSIILLDIDHFKSVNDTHGHQVGDKVLIETASLLKNNIRESDTVGRWGGEEFLVILPSCDLETAKGVAEKLRSAIEAFDFDTVGRKTSSFGVSTYKDGDSEESMVERADNALYEAKKSGRNRVVSL